MSTTTNLTAGELAAFQVGLLAGRGFTPAQILAFRDQMSVLPSVRPEPRYGDPANHCTDDCDYPTGEVSS